MIDRLRRRHRAYHELISEVVSGAATAATRDRLEAHLATCDACRERFSEEQALRKTLRSLPAIEPPRSFRLTPAMVTPPAPRARAVPTPLLFAARGIAAVSVGLFAVVAALTATVGDVDDVVAPAANDIGPAFGQIESAPAEPAAESTPVPTPAPDVAPPPPGGAIGAGAIDQSPTPEPRAPATGAEKTVPAEPDAPADGLRTLAGPADAITPAAETLQDPAPRWPLLASAAFALVAVAALAGVEIARRRRT
jgi:anti-sigma factor RsiW